MTTFDSMPAAPLDQPAVDVSDLQARIVVLKDELAQAQARATTHAQNHIRDVDLIGEMLMKEANEREWCDQYDDFVDTLNGNLHHPLPTRDQDYEATITVTVTFTARPNDYESIAGDIARAIYHKGDDLDGMDYRVEKSTLEDVNES